MSVRLLLPAAGRATRMGGLSKEVLPLSSRATAEGRAPLPILAWSLFAGARAKAETCIVVTSAKKAPVLMEATSAVRSRLPCAFVNQAEPLGLAAAVLEARPHVRMDDSVLLLLPDAVVWPPAVVIQAVEAVEAGELACVALVRSDSPERFGVAVFDREGRVTRIVDKPAAPPSPWVWTAVVFRPAFFDYIERSSDFATALNLLAEDGKLASRRDEAARYWDVGTYDGYVAAITALSAIDPSEDIVAGASPERLPNQ